MKLLNSSKAEEQTLFQSLIIILVLGVVLFTFIGYINQATSSTYHQKNFLATDLALILDTIQSLDGNLELTYSPISTKNKFLYEFENSQVKVSDSKLDVKKGNGYFLMNTNIKLKNTEISQPEDNKLIISKQGNIITINEQTNLNALECLKEKVPFVRSLTAKGTELSNTLNKIAASNFEEGNELVLNFELKEQQKNYLKVFYSSKTQQKIACEIVNKISKELSKAGEQFDGVSIVPSNKRELTLEFSKNYDIKQQTIIASAIVEGVKNAER